MGSTSEVKKKNYFGRINKDLTILFTLNDDSGTYYNMQRTSRSSVYRSECIFVLYHNLFYEHAVYT